MGGIAPVIESVFKYSPSWPRGCPTLCGLGKGWDRTRHWISLQIFPFLASRVPHPLRFGQRVGPDPLLHQSSNIPLPRLAGAPPFAVWAKGGIEPVIESIFKYSPSSPRGCPTLCGLGKGWDRTRHCINLQIFPFLASRVPHPLRFRQRVGPDPSLHQS